MNTQTGEIIYEDDWNRLSAAEKSNFIPVYRDLTIKEKAEKQIMLYSPCGCGSGKKFKFCCKK